MKIPNKKKGQSTEEYANAIADEWVTEIINTNVNMIKAVDKEDYEQAALYRDYIQSCIDSITKQTAVIMDMKKDDSTNFKITNMAISRTENIRSEVNNLIRLGLLEDVNAAGFMHSSLYNHFKLTGFARDFIEACLLKENT